MPLGPKAACSCCRSQGISSEQQLTDLVLLLQPETPARRKQGWPCPTWTLREERGWWKNGGISTCFYMLIWLFIWYSYDIHMICRYALIGNIHPLSIHIPIRSHLDISKQDPNIVGTCWNSATVLVSNTKVLRLGWSCSKIFWPLVISLKNPLAALLHAEVEKRLVLPSGFDPAQSGLETP